MRAERSPRTLRQTPPLQRQQQLLVWAAVLTFSCIAVQDATAASVNVSSSSELLEALQSQHADQIVLQNDVPMGAEFDQLDRSPLQINRYLWGQPG